MLITIKNECVHLTVDTVGAQIMSLRTADGVQYLWQGDSAYWGDRAPLLFPFIGRLTNNSYRYKGRLYRMGIHGFAAAQEFSPVEHTADMLVLELKNTLVTLTQYPFDFVLRVIYRLWGDTVAISYQVWNGSDSVMPFGIGGHPGFNVPLLEGENFEDYVLEFGTACQPDRVGFSPTVYMNGQDLPYPLEDNKRLRLQHNLFDEDAIILKNMAREVTLRSEKSGRGVKVTYPDMPYLGIWHWPKTDAPYVCIEPWSSLPSRQDIVEEFSCKSDMVQLPPKGEYENTWYITVL